MAVAAITAAVNRECIGSFSLFATYPMDNGAGTIPKGAFVVLDSSGYAINGTDAGSQIFVGICSETVTFAGTNDGDTDVEVDCTPGKWWRFGYNTGDFGVTGVGTILFLENNNAVDDAAAATNDIRVGTAAKYISADELWLRVDFVAPIAAA